MYQQKNNRQPRELTVVVIDSGKPSVTRIKDNHMERHRIVGDDFEMMFPQSPDIAIMRGAKRELVFGYDPQNERLTSLNDFVANKILATGSVVI